MKPEIEQALKALADMIDGNETLGFDRKTARTAWNLVQRALFEGYVDRTAREYLAADLFALAEGKPVQTTLAAAVENKIKLSKLEAEAAGSLLLDVQQDAIEKGKRLAELSPFCECTAAARRSYTSVNDGPEFLPRTGCLNCNKWDGPVLRSDQ